MFQRGEASASIDGATRVGVNESTAHLTALVAGLGEGQTFRFMAAPHLRSGALQAVLADWTRPRHPMHLVYPGARHLNAKLRVFSDWVTKIFAPRDESARPA